MEETNDLEEAGWYVLLTIFIIVWMMLLMMYG